MVICILATTVKRSFWYNLAERGCCCAGSQTQVLSASDYLQKRRTYRGLEAPVVGAEAKPVVKAVQGQTGRAAHYSHEDAS